MNEYIHKFIRGIQNKDNIFRDLYMMQIIFKAKQPQKCTLSEKHEADICVLHIVTIFVEAYPKKNLRYMQDQQTLFTCYPYNESLSLVSLLLFCYQLRIR